MSDPRSRPLILLVEDYDDARDMYRDFLEFSDFRVATARDGRVALAHALAPDGDRARAAGCDGFIAKPCLPGDLVAQIAAHLKLHTEPAGRARRGAVHR